MSGDPYVLGDGAVYRLGTRLALGRSALRVHGDAHINPIAEMFRLLWWLIRHPHLTIPATVAAALAVLVGPWAPLVLVAVLAALLVGACVRWPRFRGWVANRCRRTWRKGTIYDPMWRQATLLARLGTRLDDVEQIPRRLTMRSDVWGDQIMVELVPGIPAMVAQANAFVLAEAVGAQSCKAVPIRERPGFLWFHFLRRDPLADIIPALDPVPVDRLDLEAVPVGRTETGEAWTVRLSGTHGLVAGATGSGKGSVIQSIIRALAPGIAAGLVEVWGVDPKGGMELGPVRPLLARFARPDTTGTHTHPAEPLVELLEEAAQVAASRAHRLGDTGQRCHTPTVDNPAIVVIVDELGALGAYLKGELGARANRALGLVLSQGRAPGVSLVGAIQDPRKETIPYRPLFPTRVALRFTDAAADLVLGKGAIARGADCENIAEGPGGAGIGYVLRDGEKEPVRVRAAWVSDADIDWLVTTYTPPPADGPGAVLESATGGPPEGEVAA